MEDRNEKAPSRWSFPRAFWCANAIELFERWAFYGVRGIFSVYLREGLKFTHIQKGTIYSWWALIQTLLPMFTGGYSDRYGYKKTVACSIVLQVSAYILLATQTTYGGVFFACMALATATAVFKPGIQGTLAHSMGEGRAAIGWGIFYQVVNIGGFIGPWVAGYLRMIEWRYAFYASACVILMNAVILFFYPDPKPPQSKDFTDANPFKEFVKILFNSVRNIFEPRLCLFLILFSGFWLMFMQLFDLLPNFIDDWVDSSGVILFFGQLFGIQRLITLGQNHVNIPPEWMINIDAGFIIIAMVPTAIVFSRFKVLTSIILGILIASVGIVLAGASMSGALCILGIVIFAIGEMASSPKKMEYLSNIAPPEKKGLYLGYANVPVAIGWSIGSKVGGYLYEYHGDKLNFARQVLEGDFGVAKESLTSVTKEQALTMLSQKMNMPVADLTPYLFNRFHPDRMWYWFAAIGIASMVGLIIYDRIFVRGRRSQNA